MTTSTKQLVGHTTRVEELPTSKDAVNVANMEVLEQEHGQIPKQEAPEQVAPEQSLPGPLSEGQVPETNQGMPEQTTTTMSSTQGGLPNAAARGKAVAMSLITRLNLEQKQAGAEKAAESDDDVVEEIQGHPQDGRQHVYVYRRCGDHYVCQEEISIDEETQRVERAAK
jgi:hypothetical protein